MASPIVTRTGLFLNMDPYGFEERIIGDSENDNGFFGVSIEELMPCVGRRRNRVPRFPIVTHIVKNTVASSLQDMNDGFTVMTMAAGLSTRRNFSEKCHHALSD